MLSTGGESGSAFTGTAKFAAGRVGSCLFLVGRSQGSPTRGDGRRAMGHGERAHGNKQGHCARGKGQTAKGTHASGNGQGATGNGHQTLDLRHLAKGKAMGQRATENGQNKNTCIGAHDTRQRARGVWQGAINNRQQTTGQRHLATGNQQLANNKRPPATRIRTPQHTTG